MDCFLSQDGAERDLIEEINARTKLPITKQDSYGHAIYHGAARKGTNVKKQGERSGCPELVELFVPTLH